MPNPNPATRIGVLIAFAMVFLNADAAIVYAEIKTDSWLLSFFLVLLIPAMIGLLGAAIVEEVYQHSAAVTREREATKESSGL